MRFLVLSALGLGLTLSMGCRTTDDDDDTEPTGTPVDTDTDTDTDSDTQSTFDCDDGPADPDAFWGPLDKAQVTTTPPTHDAGIGALLAEMPNEGEWKVLETPLTITKAVVSAAEYAPEGKAPKNIWLRDSGGAVRTYSNFNDDPPKIQIPDDLGALRAGSVVSFTVTEISNYYGDLQITQLQDFELHTESGLVYVVDATDGTEVTFDQHRAEVAKLWVEVSEEKGNCPTSSTTTFCYGIESHGHTYELRIRKGDYQVGDCLPIAAPVGQFSGTVQFNVSDFDAVGDPF